MKKTKKALASLAIAGMTLSMLPFNAFADGTVPTRLAGGTAAQTAVAIADQTGWTGTAILASSASYGMVDALTAGPLATYLKAPILLTGAGSTLDADTKAELTKLAVKTVYVTSGTAVISQGVLDQLSGMGITVVPLGGVDRAATSVNIAKKMTGVTKVAVANGLQDALSIAAIASAANEPILLTDKNAVPASVSAYLAANPGITASDVIGGTGIISDAVKAALPGATRHAGTSAYDTNNQVIQDFNSALTYSNVYVANGVTGIDALAGAPLAAQTKSAIVLTDGTVPAAATFVHSKLATGAVVTALGGAAVVPETVRTGVATGVVAPATGNLSVTSVSAVSANSFKVVFNQAPADTSKVVFTVQNGTAPVTVSATWNTANTEATLTTSANYVAGTYSVNVKNDVTDLGNSSVVVTEQKVAKINITSTKLGVVNTTTSGGITTQTGYATYQILDQYGVDITNSALANNVQFQTGVSNTMTWKNGLLTIPPSSGINLLTFGGGVVITANDTTTGVSATATLVATTQIGTLSDITLTGLTNADNKVLTAGDTTDVFYAGYTATDISGNPTNNFTLMQQGLILGTGTRLNQLTTSSPYVTATLVQDPSDSTKGLIKVVATSDQITIDQPLVITAMTWTGKTSQINTTLKKQATVDSFTLFTPSESIASGESKTIPFSAFDQNGVALTKYSDLIGTNPNLVTFTNAIVSENVDGTLSIKNTPVLNNGTSSVPEVITAMTPSGHYTSITINIQKPVLADSLALDTSVLTPIMQQASTTTTTGGAVTVTTDGAIQYLDFGWDNGGLNVKDQYGRNIDMTTANATGVPSLYKVVPTSSDPTIVQATGYAAIGDHEIGLQAFAPGSATIRLDLVKISDGSVLDSKSVTMTVLKDTDIKGYTATQYPNALYAINGAYANIDGTLGLGTVTDQEAEYKANPTIYGTTASGANVLLKGKPILSAVSTSGDFSVYQGAALSGPYAAKGKTYGIKIVANKPADITKTDTSGTIIVTLIGADNKMHTVPIAVKGSTAKAAASTIDASVATDINGISRDGDTITLAPTGGATYASLLGSSLAKYDRYGAAGTTQNVYFAPVDQYGKEGAFLANVAVVDSSLKTGEVFTLAPNGDILYNTCTAGDSVTVSAATTTGLVKTIKIVFN